MIEKKITGKFTTHSSSVAKDFAERLIGLSLDFAKSENLEGKISFSVKFDRDEDFENEARAFLNIEEEYDPQMSLDLEGKND